MPMASGRAGRVSHLRKRASEFIGCHGTFLATM
jgi:hypothetical protein